MTEMERWIRERNIQTAEYLGGLENYGRPLHEVLKDGTVDLDKLDYRRQAISLFGFAVLTQATVDGLKKHGPYLEVGSGTGYWAWELRKQGVNIVATDPNPFTFISFPKTGDWFPLEKVNATNAVLRHHMGRTLLMVWPSLGKDWAARCLEKYRDVGGQKFVHVGEYGGCTANDRFFEVLKGDWIEVEEIPLISWSCIHDRCIVYRRK